MHFYLSPLKEKFLLTCFVLLLCTSSGISQTSSVTVPKDSLTAGEVFLISLKIQLDQSYDKVIFPDSSFFPGSIEWLGVQQFRVTDFADSISYRLQFFANQDVILPPFEIGLVSAEDTTFISTQASFLFFKSVLPSEDAELKPLKPIFTFSQFPWVLLFIILMVLVSIFLAYRVLTNKKAEPEVKYVPAAPFQNPLAHLEETLVYLKNDYNLPQTKDFKFFYSSLSDSIRRYYEDLYNIPALESTSRELLRYLDAFGVDHEMIKSTRTILKKSDMVKFAKFTPTLDSAWDCYHESINFLDRARLIDASRVSRKRAEYEESIAKTVHEIESEPEIDTQEETSKEAE